MNEKINVKLRKDQLDEVAQNEGERLSKCCDAQMFDSGQCVTCGADGAPDDIICPKCYRGTLEPYGTASKKVGDNMRIKVAVYGCDECQYSIEESELIK